VVTLQKTAELKKKYPAGGHRHEGGSNRPTGRYPLWGGNSGNWKQNKINGLQAVFFAKKHVSGVFCSLGRKQN